MARRISTQIVVASARPSYGPGHDGGSRCQDQDVVETGTASAEAVGRITGTEDQGHGTAGSHTTGQGIASPRGKEGYAGTKYRLFTHIVTRL